MHASHQLPHVIKHIATYASPDAQTVLQSSPKEKHQLLTPSSAKIYKSWVYDPTICAAVCRNSLPTLLLLQLLLPSSLSSCCCCCCCHQCCIQCWYDLIQCGHPQSVVQLSSQTLIARQHLCQQTTAATLSGDTHICHKSTR